jgi:hypothetical protein
VLAWPVLVDCSWVIANPDWLILTAYRETLAIDPDSRDARITVQQVVLRLTREGGDDAGG